MVEPFIKDINSNLLNCKSEKEKIYCPICDKWLFYISDLRGEHSRFFRASALIACS